MLLEAAHTSDASFDPPMVLFKSIVQVDARPVTDVAAQCRADRAWVRIMPVGCHPVRHKAGNRPCRAEEPPSRFHVTGRAQHRVDEIPVTIDCPIQVAPVAMDLEVGFVARPCGQSEHWRRQRRAVEDTVAALVELLVAAPASEPTIALRCQVRPLGLQPTQSIATCPVAPPSGNPRKPHHALPTAPARAVTKPLQPHLRAA